MSKVSVRFKSFHYLVLGLTGLMAVLFIAGALRFLPVSGDNVYPEAAGVMSAHRWASGLPLYENYRHAPYLVTAFPPIWYSALALADRAGLSSLDSLTLFGRILSLACLFGIVCVGFRWNRQLGVPGGLALLMPTLYLSFPILNPWAVAARPDFLELLLGILALYYAVSRSDRAVVLGVSATMAALAFLVRHNAVAVPVAIVLWLIWSRKWKHAALFCAVWGVVVAGTLMAFQRTSHGLLLLNLSGAKFGHLAVTYIRDVLGRLLEAPGSGFAILLLALGILGFVESLRGADKRTRLACFYLVVSSAFALLGAAAAGAAVNHLLEPALALAILAPIGFVRLKMEWQDDAPLSVFAAILVAVLLLPALDVHRWNVMHSRPNDLRGLLPVMQRRAVFTDIPYLAARASSPAFLDTASLVNAEAAGSQDSWSADLAAAFAEKKYEYVIFSAPVEALYNRGDYYPRYPHLDFAIQSAVRQNYELCSVVGSTYIYVPISSGTASNTSCRVSDELMTIQSAAQRIQK